MGRFIEKLEQAWAKNDSLVCVGLDPDLTRVPKHLLKQENAIFAFNRAIIKATADLVCAYKPQIAHYSAMRAEDQLERTIQHIHECYPDVPVILDAKRGDIGSTARMYAREAFCCFPQVLEEIVSETPKISHACTCTCIEIRQISFSNQPFPGVRSELVSGAGVGDSPI